MALLRPALLALVLGELTPGDAPADPRVEVVGDEGVLDILFGHLDVFMSMFPIVEP